MKEGYACKGLPSWPYPYPNCAYDPSAIIIITPRFHPHQSLLLRVHGHEGVDGRPPPFFPRTVLNMNNIKPSNTLLIKGTTAQNKLVAKRRGGLFVCVYPPASPSPFHSPWQRVSSTRCLPASRVLYRQRQEDKNHHIKPRGKGNMNK